MLIPRLCRPLLIYKISMSVANHVKQKICSYLKKWQNISLLCLSSSSSSCPVSLKSLTSILESNKISRHFLLRQSEDIQIYGSTPQLKSGFWDVTVAVLNTESRLQFQKVTGYHQISRAGFGLFKSPPIPHRNSHQYRKVISYLVREVDENAYQAEEEGGLI